MSSIRTLASQTAIYGLSSIVGRFLNYLLVPIYTRVFMVAEYGVVTELYSYVAFFTILLTYGLETAFFRFMNKPEYEKTAFGTSFISLSISSLVFMSCFYAFANPIATAIGYPNHPEYVRWFTLVLGFDAIASILFAKLRHENKAIQFAIIRVGNILINIALILFFLFGYDYLLQEEILSASIIALPNLGVGFVFLANMIASIVTLLALLPITRLQLNFSTDTWKKMTLYALPLVLVGFAGIANEHLDKILLKYLLPFTKEENLKHVGIYGACYKLSILMTLFTQAFRFAAEPFFFKEAKEKDGKQQYIEVMDYFVIIGCIIFLLITLYIDVFKYFISEPYWEGLTVVPILLMANLFLGIYYNLSIWYKITDKTFFGAIIALIGSVVTVLLNLWWIPVLGYVGSAWATLVTYSFMTLLSYLFGQRYFTVSYHLSLIVLYLSVTLVLFFSSGWLQLWLPINKYITNTFLFLGFLSFLLFVERTVLRKRLKK